MGDQTADGAILLNLAREALNKINAELEEMRKELKPYIEAIDNPTQRKVMRLRYMKGMSVREIAYRECYSEPYIFRLLRRGEQAVIEMTKKDSQDSSFHAKV